MKKALLFTSLLALSSCVVVGCSDDSADNGDNNTGGAGGAGGRADDGYVLMNIIIDAENNRTSYLQATDAIDGKTFGTDGAVEVAGNAVFLGSGSSVFIGAQESPTWTRYDITSDYKVVPSDVAPLSFANYTTSGVGYAHTLVNETTAFTIIVEQAVGLFWNPQTMKITGEVDLSEMLVDNFGWEAWTTTSHDGKIYVPGRYANWTPSTEIREGVRMAIIDAESQELLGIAEDDRCSSAGGPVFDADGYAYVMGDGRNYSAQMVVNATNAAGGNEEVPKNCILRIAPNALDFEDSYYHAVVDLTGGYETVTELATGTQGSGLAIAKMFYPDELPDGVEPVDFAFWNYPAFRGWRIELGDNPTAEVIPDSPFSAIGFTGTASGGYYYVGESADQGATTDVYEFDLEANTAEKRFSMTGYFSQMHVIE